MADEHDLRELFAGIEPSEQEMAIYRSRLATTLESRQRRPRAWMWLAASVPLLASLVWIAGLVSTGSPGLPQQTLEELRSLVAETSDLEGLRETARRLERNAEGLERHNATMVLCLTQPDGQALRSAATGIESDPRSEFRSFYLEYLLDYADTYQLNPDRIEQLMESENDAVCLDLYGWLLRMTQRA
jgi:hypothetical protein